jgi:hypothetical protein
MTYDDGQERVKEEGDINGTRITREEKYCENLSGERDEAWWNFL